MEHRSRNISNKQHWSTILAKLDVASEKRLLDLLADEIMQRAESLTLRERRFIERKLQRWDDLEELFTSPWQRHVAEGCDER